MNTLGLDDDAFRSELREWFARNPPPEPRDASAGLNADYDSDDVAQQRQWQKRLAEAGLSGSPGRRSTAAEEHLPCSS